MFTTFIIVVLFLAVLIIGHEFGHFFAAKLFGMRVDEFGLGFPPKVLSKRVGETTYSVNAIPFGGFVKIYGEDGSTTAMNDPRSFRGAALWKRAIVIASGVLMNIFLAWIAFSIVFMTGVPGAVFVESVQPGTPAEAIGLQLGDELLDFETTTAFTTYVAEHAGEEISLLVRRGGEELTLSVTPRLDPPEGEGRVGVAVIEGGFPAHGFFGALMEGAKAVGRVSVFIASAFFSLFASAFGGEWSAFEAVSGPVGIFNAVGSASKMGIVYLMQLLGLISVNLAIINILPFPALDGGRLVFLLGEPLFGKARTMRFEAVTNAFGFALLILLMVVITVRDVLNIF